jgi:hypothetical protein
MRLVFIAALTAALSAPCQAIVGGSPTTAFAAVGVGVQVTPDWVLTVQHAALGVGEAYTNGYGSRTVLARYDAPGSGVFPANDLTLLRLAPAVVSVPSLALADDLFAEGSFASLAATITSPNNSGPARGFGYTTVSEFAADIDPDGAGPSGPVAVNYLISLDTSVYVQSGDSGGGLFVGQVQDSGSPLLGLNSALLSDQNGQPIGSGFVLLAAYRTWIDQTLAAAPANSQTLNWVSAVPEPTTALLLLLGAAMLALRRALGAT